MIVFLAIISSLGIRGVKSYIVRFGPFYITLWQCFAFFLSHNPPNPHWLFPFLQACVCVCVFVKCAPSTAQSCDWLARFVGGKKNGWVAGRVELRDSADSGTRPHCSPRLVTLHLPASSQTAHWPTTSAGAKGTAVLNSTKKILSLPPLVPQWENSAANITVDTGPFRLQYLCCISTSWREVFWW